MLLLISSNILNYYNKIILYKYIRSIKGHFLHTSLDYKYPLNLLIVLLFIYYCTHIVNLT